MGEAALAALPRRESHRPPLLTPYSRRELTPRRFSRRSTQAIPSTRSSRVILPRPRGRPIPHGLRHTCRPATAAFADHPRSRCQRRTALQKRAVHPARPRASTLRIRSPESGTGSAFTARYPDTKSSINPRPASTTHRLRRQLVEVASALLLRSAGAEREAVAQVAARGDIAASRGSRIADRDASTDSRTRALLTTNQRPTRTRVDRLPRSHDCDG